ncbi:type II secretion system protein G [Anaerohalosphaera lusitana]|uniref:Type II secretion system protein G n=2 Tax=Anaerohalosphaera lusitana TaxID=1936003 RepID=A0A1U9NL26_9BACT|nr:type II secretion system protein G [Anaerohalosphaera lusitana]
MFARRNNKRNVGFTLVEMLVTIGIIAVVIGMLVPALSMVRDTANRVKQKAQFSTLEVGLEAFKNDFGDYPPDVLVGGDVSGTYEYTSYTGAQRLAEAIIGQDGFGVNTGSSFNGDMSFYGMYTDPVTDEQRPIGTRQGPYVEIENANATRLSAIYPDTALTSTSLNPATFVLSDEYGLVKSRISGEQTGMPVLYYKANTSKFGHSELGTTDYLYYNTDKNVYNPICNRVIYGLGSAPSVQGANMLNGPGTFWDYFLKKIENPNFSTNSRPYRAQSFILHSAGADGRYGTSDDIYNFDKK